MIWTTFPLLPINPDGSCGCGNAQCANSGKHPAVRWGRDSLGAGVQIPVPEGFGVGVATGKRSGVIGIDLDRKGGLDGLESLHLLGDVPETLTASTPTGGFHLYFEAPDFDVRNSASVLGPGIDVRGEGGFLVLPPSPHRKGGRYAWVNPGTPIAALPDWLRGLLAAGGAPRTRVVKRETLERLAGTWRRSKSVGRQELGEALGHVAKGEPFADPGERDQVIWDLSVALGDALPHADPAALAALFGSSLELMGRESADCPTVETVAEKLGRVYREARDADGGAWTARLACSENGLPKACLGNAVLALENHPAVRECFGHDERRGVEVVTKATPWEGDVPRDVTDAEATRCAVWLTEKMRMPVSADICRKAIDAAAAKRPFDRVKAYLEGLQWDGRPRVDGWLVHYGTAIDSPYARAVGAKWLLSAVARALEPGCKVDTMLILEGEQGRYKSSLLRALAGADFFTDELPDLETKDAKDHLRGPWIIEIKELQAFDRKETNLIKGFLDQRRDRFRPAYAAKTIEVARRCVFAGTTNATEYLKDWTGNRRYWPVRVQGWCRHEQLAADRDQVWAEAVARFRAREPWWLDSAQEALAAEEQERREEVDPWHDLVVKALAEGVRRRLHMVGGASSTEWLIPPAPESVSVSELLEHVIGVKPEHRTRHHEMRVATVLRAVGAVRTQVRRGVGREWRYVTKRVVGAGVGVGDRIHQ